MGIFETLGNKFKEHFDRKKQEKQQFEQLRRETENQRMITEEQTQRAQAQGLAVKQAQSEIAGKTGIIRMRAVQKAKLLASQQPRDSAVQRFREMTARNKQRTARNREMHAERRMEQQKIREQRLMNAKPRRLGTLSRI